MHKISGVWVRFPAPSKSKSFRLVLQMKAVGKAVGRESMSANRTLVQKVTTLFTWGFALFKGFTLAQQGKPPASYSLWYLSSCNWKSSLQNKGKFDEKKKTGTQRFESSETSFPDSQSSDARQRCGETGHHSTNEGVLVIPSQKTGPTKGLYLPPEPSTAKRV